MAKKRQMTQHEKALSNALAEVLEVAKTGTILDRHGERHDACSLTCLTECETVARKALKEFRSERS